MSGSMEEEYVLHLEDLSDFVEEILLAAGYHVDQFTPMYTFWLKKFKESAALIISDQLITDYLSDFESESLNSALRELVKEGEVAVMWDSENNDFVFKVVE